MISSVIDNFPVRRSSPYFNFGFIDSYKLKFKLNGSTLKIRKRSYSFYSRFFRDDYGYLTGYTIPVRLCIRRSHMTSLCQIICIVCHNTKPSCTIFNIICNIINMRSTKTAAHSDKSSVHPKSGYPCSFKDKLCTLIVREPKFNLLIKPCIAFIRICIGKIIFFVFFIFSAFFRH